MSISPPPIQQALVDEQGTPTLPWVMFFNETYLGDTGTAWNPNFVNLSTTGTPTITGRYYKLSSSLVYFSVLITPATDTSSTAGTTYIDNFPLNVRGDGICFAVSGGLGTNSGHVIASSKRIYTPTWTSVTVPLTVIGMMEAQ